MLSVKDKMRLQVEAQRWAYAGAKDAHVRELLGESPTVHYARLNQLLDDPRALAHAPMLVRRLQRLRDARQSARGARIQGWTV